MNELEYSLLEIIEDPRRLGNLPHDRILFYINEALETEERFDVFMASLRDKAWWAYYGFCIMCSDILPLNYIFEEELSAPENQKSRAVTSSGSELIAFNNLLYNFERGLLTEKKHRVNYFRTLMENYSENDYDFIVTCIRQEYKDKLLPMMKHLWETRQMPEQCFELFSFTDSQILNRIAMSDNLVVVNNYREIKKIGNIFFTSDGKFVDRNLMNYLQKVIQNTNHTRINNIMFDYPRICNMWLDDNNNIILINCYRGVFVFYPTVKHNDASLMRHIYDGAKAFISMNVQNGIIGCVSRENGSLEEITLKVKKPKRFDVPLVIMNMSISMLTFSSVEEDGKETEYCAFIPKTAPDVKTGDEITLIRLNETYYVKG